MADDTRAIEQLVEQLQSQIPFKSTTTEGDLVLILRENDSSTVSMGYAKVMGFDRDVSKRDEWWHVHLLFLEVPPLSQTIILQTAHITGAEIFTMGGRKVFIKAIDYPPMNHDEVLTPQDDQPLLNKKKGPQGSKLTFTLVKPQ